MKVSYRIISLPWKPSCAPPIIPPNSTRTPGNEVFDCLYTLLFPGCWKLESESTAFLDWLLSLSNTFKFPPCPLAAPFFWPMNMAPFFTAQHLLHHQGSTLLPSVCSFVGKTPNLRDNWGGKPHGIRRLSWTSGVESRSPPWLRITSSLLWILLVTISVFHLLGCRGVY